MNLRRFAAVAVLGIAVVGFHADQATAQMGACCTGGSCSEVDMATCTGGGGYYAGDGTLCMDTDCNEGACCNNGVCSDISAAECESLTGYFAGNGTLCSTPTDCTEGACCFNGQCRVETLLECNGAGGSYLGDATTCPGTCTIACKDIDEIRSFPQETITKTCSKVIVSLLDSTASGSNRGFTVQDTSGVDMSGPGGATRGILIFGFDSDFGAGTEWDDFVDGLSEGETIDVQGDLSSFAGVLEFVPHDFADITTGAPTAVPAPVVITAADLTDGTPTEANLQSVRVKIECVSFTAAGNFGGGTDYEITDGVDTLTGKVRIVTNDVPQVGTPIPFGPVDLTGVYSEFFGNIQINLETIEAASNCPTATGRCCYPDGSCAETIPGLCSQGGTFELGVDCSPNDCPLPIGACCTGGACTNETQADCENGGGAWKGPLTDCFFGCPDVSVTLINEIRIDQLSSDNSEYFELIGPPGGALGNLTFLAIGGNGGSDSGVIEAVVPLNATQIPADGIFVAVESTFDLGQFPISTDLVTSMNFENGDNVTYMLVSGFSGTAGQDLDTNDDCSLDITPWTAVIDSVAVIVEDNPPVNTHCHYGPPTVGPDGAFLPGHVLRCDEAPVTPWRYGPFDIAVGLDTPGGPNDCTPFVCGTCPGDLDGDNDVDFDDAGDFVDAILGITSNPCADVNQDSFQNGADVNLFVSLVIGSGGLSPTPCVDVILTRCDAGGDGSCETATNFCRLAANFGACSAIVGPVCVQCESGNCFEQVGPLVFGRIVDGDGVGMDCTFVGSVEDDQCLTCPAGLIKLKVVH